MPRVAVLGAGISGLAAAHRILELSRERNASVELDVYEASDRAGGCVQTIRDGEVLMELGADSLLIEKPAAHSLASRLGIASEIVPMQQRGAHVAWNGRLHRIPPEFRLFAPRSIPALVHSGLFSPIGLMRAAAEPFVPARRDHGDESLASFVKRRLGREVLQRLAQPLVGGIYSADPSRLSMQMALPQFLQYEREYGSLWRGLRAAPPAPAPQLVSFRNGIGTMVNALVDRVAPHLRLNHPAQRVEHDGSRWRVASADTSAVYDGVICALQAPVAARVLASADATIAQLLQTIRCNSIAAVNLLYESNVLHLPYGSGFVVPFAEGAAICAVTFASQKYAYRSGPDYSLVRVFLGGALQGEIVQRADDELEHAAHAALVQYVGVKQAPVRTVISRWENTLPEYAVNHQSTVRSLFERADRLGTLALAGCTYRGVGIPDSLASGEAAAESVFGYVSSAKGA